MNDYIKSLKALDISNTKPNGYKVLDLFAGCGGLALGFEAAGFDTIGFEKNSDAVLTYNSNLKGICHEKYLTEDSEFPQADIVIGGPPCQPFSVGGNQNGLKDSRDGFPTFISAVSKLRPDLWLFENVRGMMYRNKDYLNEIVITLEGLGYDISYDLLKAVNYGVPQNRERLVVVGHKKNFFFPAHLEKKHTAGSAIEDIAFNIDEHSKIMTKSQDLYVAKYEKASKCINPRDQPFQGEQSQAFIIEKNSFPGHSHSLYE